jgi:hypothetical protein
MLKVCLYLEPLKLEHTEEVLSNEKTAIMHSIKQPQKTMVNIYKSQKEQFFQKHMHDSLTQSVQQDY